MTQSRGNILGALPWTESGASSALAAEAVYCLVSAGTILFNKHALSTYQFPAPNALLTVQFGIAVLLLKILDFVGILHLEPMRWEVIKMWIPVNVIFVLMNASGFYALMSVSAGMFTVLKNLSNLLTILGDWYFFDKTYSWQVWACLGLMILSAAMGGWTDLSFSPSGYAWQLVNCVFTAAYSLHLSSVVRAVSTPRRLSELSMVYYNNVLSVPLLMLLSVAFGEPARLRNYALLRDPEFNLVVLMGALLGFGVSFASIWCMSRTSATIYSLTGSMNKVVVAVAGMWYFAEPASATNVLSIAMGLLAGFLFVFAKSAPAPGRSPTVNPETQALVAAAVEGAASGGAGEKTLVINVSGSAGVRELTSRSTASGTSVSRNTNVNMTVGSPPGNIV
ncbi:hypothetical protein VOLCADRAFT_66734 [Volvox carteri f. nagariensis]|uniref:Sugar phosphate transporter domain-containing protein n=1 Tax=Volvox carteri f. nagariensis TaxID=3068 RepID=D8UC58_VOLCA|nr:uncharacterized protein VOLCADRAFT_66734 [Volvox carteri f. nagariensis]EFJ42785.1 hypothetical protein VOLCADRAFT_66734 [Volvox carteri f. nagariensis]|eukprot:XP_002956246.1 hypothetical protein VOLCADRAFT_66734 [Volvox carteri f. nagariensis]